MINFVGPLLDLKYSASATNAIEQAVELICDDRNVEAIRILDTIGARAKPQYGHEIISAVVFYYKGMAEANLGNIDSARYYLEIVEKIPSWRVIFGKETLNDVKEEARILKFKI